MEDRDRCRRPFTRGECRCRQCNRQACTHAECLQAREARTLARPLLGQPPGVELAEPPCCCRALFNATGQLYSAAGNRVCDPCRDARKAMHGANCCRWYWSGAREAFRTSVFMPEGRAPDAADACEASAASATLAASALREQELARRQRWCIENGFVPANTNLWRAPSTTQQDLAMGPAGLPWHGDGRVRVAGVPCGLAIPLPRDKHVPDEGGEWSYSCTKCACTVQQRPRAFEGGPEPCWWRWCAECRRSVPAEKPRDQRMRKAAAGSRDIRGTWGVAMP